MCLYVQAHQPQYMVQFETLWRYLFVSQTNWIYYFLPWGFLYGCCISVELRSRRFYLLFGRQSYLIRYICRGGVYKYVGTYIEATSKESCWSNLKFANTPLRFDLLLDCTPLRHINIHIYSTLLPRCAYINLYWCRLYIETHLHRNYNNRKINVFIMLLVPTLYSIVWRRVASKTIWKVLVIVPLINNIHTSRKWLLVLVPHKHHTIEFYSCHRNLSTFTF